MKRLKNYLRHFTAGLLILLLTQNVFITNQVYAAESLDSLIEKTKPYLNDYLTGEKIVTKVFKLYDDKFGYKFTKSKIIGKAGSIKLGLEILYQAISRGIYESQIRNGADEEHVCFVPPNFKKGHFNITAYNPDSIVDYFANNKNPQEELFKIKMYSQQNPRVPLVFTLKSNEQISIPVVYTNYDLIFEFYHKNDSVPFEKYYLSNYYYYRNKNDIYGIALNSVGNNKNIYYLKKENSTVYNENILNKYFPNKPFRSEYPSQYERIPQKAKELAIRKSRKISKQDMSPSGENYMPLRENFVTNAQIDKQLKYWQLIAPRPVTYTIEGEWNPRNQVNTSTVTSGNISGRLFESEDSYFQWEIDVPKDGWYYNTYNVSSTSDNTYLQMIDDATLECIDRILVPRTTNSGYSFQKMLGNAMYLHKGKQNITLKATNSNLTLDKFTLECFDEELGNHKMYQAEKYYYNGTGTKGTPSISHDTYGSHVVNLGYNNYLTYKITPKATGYYRINPYIYNKSGINGKIKIYKSYQKFFNQDNSKELVSEIDNFSHTVGNTCFAKYNGGNIYFEENKIYYVTFEFIGDFYFKMKNINFIYIGDKDIKDFELQGESFGSQIGVTNKGSYAAISNRNGKSMAVLGYGISVPTNGNYRIKYRASTNETNARLTFGVSYDVNDRNRLIPKTSNESSLRSFQLVEGNTVYLPKGGNSVFVYSSNDSFDLDKIIFEKVN